MSKPRCPNVGHYRCPNPDCRETGAIRRQRGGELYGVCRRCGPLYWRTQAGQDFFLQHGTIWGAAGAPATIPEWIRSGFTPEQERRLIAHPPQSSPEPKETPAASQAEKKPDPATAAAASQTEQPKVKTTPDHAEKKSRAWWEF